uniref:Uncharacterized protein n=1 Tax=Arundo donax TaxID=35708 RepID=A0A0A9BXW4_ARUDO
MTQVYSSESACSATSSRVARTAEPAFPPAATALGNASSRNGLMESRKELLHPKRRELASSAVRASTRPRPTLGGLDRRLLKSSGDVGLQTESGSTALLEPLLLSLTKRPGTLKNPVLLLWPLDSTMAWPSPSSHCVAFLPSTQDESEMSLKLCWRQVPAWFLGAGGTVALYWAGGG